jgi:hypothetical protein
MSGPGLIQRYILNWVGSCLIGHFPTRGRHEGCGVGDAGGKKGKETAIRCVRQRATHSSQDRRAVYQIYPCAMSISMVA